jgi:1,2-diacylglycerol 3-alpha-glucosyltransferase
MKAAFFTDTYLPNVDGVVRAILNFRGELEKRGNEVYVFASGTKIDTAANNDKRVFFYSSIKFPPYPQYKLAVFPYHAAKVKARDTGIELVHSHAIANMGLAAIGTAKALNLPLVGTFHTLVPKAVQIVAKRNWSKKAGEAIAWKLVEAFYTPFDLVTAPSKTICVMMEEHGIKNCTPVPNGIDLNRFKESLDRNWARKPLGLAPDEKLILVAGRFSREKNVDVVVKAFDRVLRKEKAKLVISGEGPAKQEVISLVEKMGLQKHVQFLGFLPEQELPLYYAAADVFVTASTFETQGLTVLESMACGTPVVGANSMAIPETIKDKQNGLLFAPMEEDDCAEKILDMLQMQAKYRNTMRENARKTAESYSIARMTDVLLKAYAKVL